jgi:hypothetical protein
MLPPWLSFGSILVVVGGILILVGFIINLVGVAGAATNESGYMNAIEAFDALVGVGIFVAILGWFFHQMTLFHRSSH